MNEPLREEDLFKPISPEERFSSAPRRSSTLRAPVPMRPGQLYGGSVSRPEESSFSANANSFSQASEPLWKPPTLKPTSPQLPSYLKKNAARPAVSPLQAPGALTPSFPAKSFPEQTLPEAAAVSQGTETREAPKRRSRMERRERSPETTQKEEQPPENHSREPLYSAAPRRRAKSAAVAPEPVPESAANFWQDPPPFSMGSELEAFFSADVPEAEIVWPAEEADANAFENWGGLPDPWAQPPQSVPPADDFPLDGAPPGVFWEEESLPRNAELSQPPPPLAGGLHGFDALFQAPPGQTPAWRPPAYAAPPPEPPERPPNGESADDGDNKPSVSSRKGAAKPQRRNGQEAAKPPVSPSRVAALAAVACMLLFCGIAGGRIIVNLAQNEREMEELRQEYREQGWTLEEASVRVELPPPGQTFAPTATPAAVSAAAPSVSEQSAGAEEPQTAARTRLTRYPKNTLRNVLDSMSAYQQEYPEVMGRISIPGVLDEIFAQRNNTFYLTHNYRGALADGGAVFLDESCSLKTPPENMLLRGVGSVQGKSFSPLWQYQTQGDAFAVSACYADVTTLYEEERYVLFAVVVAESDPTRPGYFDYVSHASFSSDAEMSDYVQEARERSLYQFSVSVEPSDRLLTLATVSSDTDGKCLVLLFRMLRDGEA